MKLANPWPKKEAYIYPQLVVDVNYFGRGCIGICVWGQIGFIEWHNYDHISSSKAEIGNLYFDTRQMCCST